MPRNFLFELYLNNKFIVLNYSNLISIEKKLEYEILFFMLVHNI